jgi:hypothetical protein
MPAQKDPDQGSAQSAAPSDSGEPDLKAKFREALERKNGQHADSGGAEGRSGGKGGGRSHGPARTQRTFRRKSG